MLLLRFFSSPNTQKSGKALSTLSRRTPKRDARAKTSPPSPIRRFGSRHIRVIRAIRSCRLFPRGFKRAVFRRPLPDKWSEFHFAADRVWRLELSLKHQCSRVAADISERKFHRAGKRHRVLIAWRPLRFRRFRGTPPTQHWIHQQESAFSVGLSVEAQRTLGTVREINFDLPATEQTRRLSLSHGDEAGCVGDQNENQCADCSHAFSYFQFGLSARGEGPLPCSRVSLTPANL